MILLIDNYDSFTYNLVQYIGEVNDKEVKVIRNDAISIEEVLNLKPTHIILSPGPRTPNQAGICVELVKHAAEEIPILGVCLGHQAIAQAFGAKITRAQKQMHGKVSKIIHDGKDIFENCSNPLTVGRYHSLIATDLPAEINVRARDENGEIMAISHALHQHVIGVQFHPESILTNSGREILRSFLKRDKKDYKTTNEESNNITIGRA